MMLLVPRKGTHMLTKRLRAVPSSSPRQPPSIDKFMHCAKPRAISAGEEEAAAAASSSHLMGLPYTRPVRRPRIGALSCVFRQ